MPRALGTDDGVREGNSSQVKNESKRERVRQARQGKKPLKNSRDAVVKDHHLKLINFSVKYLLILVYLSLKYTNLYLFEK